ncbi:hypothetical protein A3715_15550 [Oleiphilus sp. HI0009]|nr:hypothetical protein A3715_15550 [Oleiphilus sp. HI0009]
MQHKEPIRVSIAAKGKGEIDFFIADYSMKEHFDELPEKHGASVAEEVYGLDRNCYVIATSPVENAVLDKKVAGFLGVDGVTEGQYVIDKVINPLHGCFRNFRIEEIDGKKLAISKPYSFGWRYGKVIPEWVKEAGEFSSISLSA